MPTFDPNIMLGILQGAQSGQAFPTSVQGIPEQILPKMQERLGAMNPERLSAITTGFQNFAPTWQQGQQWGRRDILGSMGGMGGMSQPQTGGTMMAPGGGMGGMRGGFDDFGGGGHKWGGNAGGGAGGGLRGGGSK